MIVWGGWDGSCLLDDGARYNPITDTWTAFPSNGATPTGGSGPAIAPLRS
jgi:hypothetical protein